ncbi:MAG TPA: sensor histidine kinase [Bacteroidetes bacterium]|nr:sensor histidine kinase [Bacteroidota bacterium]
MKNLVLSNNTYRSAVLIIFLIIIITILHYSTDVHQPYYHEIYKILYYVPIILAAFSFGVAGGVVVAFTISLIYTPHVVTAWNDHDMVMLDRFVEMVIFNAVAYITGKLVEAEREERLKYEKVAHELQESYTKLQEQSERLTEVEEQLRAAERLGTLGELTASLAHEVRNPLAAIKGATEILRDSFPPDSKNAEFARQLIFDVERINKVIENYLSIVRSKPESVEFDLVQATRDTIRLLSTRARKEKKQLKHAFPRSKVIVTGDEIKYRQVIINLLMNAFSASEPGSEVLVTIERHGRGENAFAEVVISDTGSGIPREYLDKIFKPFFTTRKDGTGLGLPISQRIAKDFGWTLEIESDEGVGTTVKLTIPLHQKKVVRE